MPRPCKRRRVCAMPACKRFGPKGTPTGNNKAIAMTVDEYETVRLIDLEGLTQEECAVRMNVARTTAQAIYNSARAKIAECLVDSRELRIEGGEYDICNGNMESCGCPHCRRQFCHNNNEGEEEK